MKIKVLHEIKDINNIIDEILAYRGVSREWLNAGEKDLLDGREMRNFDEAEQLLKSNLDKNIAIYVDSDTDGFCSSSIMYMWLKERFAVEAKIIIPEGKVHGILEQLIPEDIDLLIVPDASSSEGLIHQKLLERGTKVLVLDHHEIDLSNGEYAVIVNPRHPQCEYENKSLSGTGVVYKFIEGVDKNTGVDYHTKHLDLTAVATVADMMTLKEIDNKAMVNLGLKNFSNKYFLEYKKTNGYLKDKDIDATMISMNLVPPINALIRIGTVNDKRDLFEALVGKKVPQLVASGVKSLKGSQDRTTEKLLIRIGANLQNDEEALSHSVIFAKAPFNCPKSLTGLIAAKLTSLYKRPAFVYREEDGNLIGSGRNVNNSPIEALKDFCMESGVFNWAAGHQSAFGFSIPAYRLDDFLAYTDNNLPPYEPVYYVDFALAGDKGALVKELAELAPHYGPGFGPITVLDNVIVKPSDIAIKGEKQNTLVVKLKDMEYINFKFGGELPLDFCHWTIIGKPSINEYMGRRTPQIVMEGWITEPVDI